MDKFRSLCRRALAGLRSPYVTVPALFLAASVPSFAEGATGTVSSAFTTALDQIKADLVAYSNAIAPWVVDVMMLGLVIVAFGLLWRLIKRFFGRA